MKKTLLCALFWNCVFIYTQVLLASGVRNSTGTQFAIAFPAAKYDELIGSCIVYVSAFQTTTFTIESALVDPTEHTVNAQNTYKLEFSPAVFRLSEGIENKVIYLNAQDEVSVAVSNINSDDHMDMILSLPKYEGTNEYYVMNHATINNPCDNDNTLSYFNILAFDDATVVNIYDPGETSPTEVTLNAYQAYTRRNTGSDSELTGVRIVSDKAVSVTSGNPCSDLSTGFPGPIWSSIPTSVEVGVNYIAPEVFYWYSKTYKLRVLALQDDTSVSFVNSEENEILQAGEYFDLEIIGTAEVSEEVRCSNSCQVAQYGTGNGVAFMSLLPSTEQFVRNAQFTFSNTYFNERLVYVILLSEDTSGITIDGGSFVRSKNYNGYTWLIGDFDDTSIKEEWHVIESDEPFSVLCIGFKSNNNWYGFGYNGAFSSMGVEPDIPEPEVNATLPAPPDYEISMDGLFYSADGSDFSQECRLEYSQAMSDRTVEMIPKVNSEIGDSLCNGHDKSEMRVTSSSTLLQTQENQGVTTLWFSLSVNSTTLTPAVVQQCGNEIGVYLLPHANWPNPILSPVTGCSEVRFTSEFFNDTGSSWKCSQQQTNNPKATTLGYVLAHKGSFSTEDSSDISAECSIGYSENFKTSTENQAENVKTLMGSGQLCTGSDGVMLVSATTTMSIQGSQGQTFQDYFFSVGDDTTLWELNTCIAEVSIYLKPHSAWTAPIIEAPGACPAVVFDPNFFTEDKQEWICPS